MVAEEVRELIYFDSYLLIRDLEPLLCTWSRGIPMCLTSWS